ncbi:MAG: chromate transporter [Acetobacteraceae bacterium]|nr:chromate transporter [Acetobacteraceae bacterium]
MAAGAPVADLAVMFGQLSLVSIGGVHTVLPELKRQVVESHGWMSSADFAALYALAQAAPGPNMLVSTLIGWQVAGLAGALAATAALVAPCALLTFLVAGAWHRFRDRPWRRLVQDGLMPLTAGLVVAAAIVLSEATAVSIGHALVTAIAAALLVLTRLHPLWLLGAGAALGGAGIL